MKALLNSLLFLGLWSPDAIAESSNPTGHAPQICTGARADGTSWGLYGSLVNENTQNCPENQAFFSAKTNQKRDLVQGSEFVGIVANCCQLPSEDILTEIHSETFDRCPENFVATGARFESIPESCLSKQDITCFEDQNKTKVLLRCTKINIERYQLGTAKGGVTMALTTHFRGTFDERISRSDIPAAIRYGTLRSSQTTWDGRACIGVPWGALLAAKETKNCSGVLFRELQFAGIKGDPQRGTPVKIFPECLAIAHPMSLNAECVGADSK